MTDVRCTACGSDNPARARFCLDCGAALGPVVAAREIRKVVTVLFADISGSTALGEARDPEATRALLARYFAAMRAAIERHGGTVEKFAGDAVMAVFGIPVAHEDDALRAVRAATDMAGALDELDRELGARIRIRTGINSGEVVAGVAGPGGGSDETLVTGDTVNVAARLEQAARPGEVLLGEMTVRLTRGALEAGPALTLELKGKTGLVNAHRLIRLAPISETFTRRAQTPMIGREREIAALQDAFAVVESNAEPRLVAITGPPGVGKSRVVREFLGEAGSHAAVLRGRCLPYGQGITFWPVAEIVRQAAGIGEAATADDARARLRQRLTGMPDAGHVGTALERLLGLAPQGSSVEELAWATRRLLERLAEESPVVVLIEDIHWAEPALLDLVDHVITSGRSPILVIAPARSEIADIRPDLLVGPRARHLALDPLTDDVASELIDRLLPGRGQLAALRQRIVDAADGNPLYVEELVAMLVDGGFVRRAADGSWAVERRVDRIAMPPTISALLTARLDQLGPERAVAERGSVVGRVFEHREVAQLSPDLAVGELDERLALLVDHDLVRPESASVADELAYRFRHILIRDAAYEALPKRERWQLHESLADWLEAVAGDRLVEIEEIVGYHQEQAIHFRRELGVGADTELVERAAGHLAAAGTRAADRGDLGAAANLLDRAARLMPTEDPRRDRLLLDLAIATHSGGGITRAQDILTDVIDRATRSGDEATRLHAVVIRWDTADVAGREQTLRADVDRAISVLSAAGDDLGLARAWRLLGGAHWDVGEGAAAEASTLRALDHATRSGRRSEVVSAYGSLTAILNTGPAQVDEAIERCREILVAEQDDRVIEAWMNHALGHLLAKRGEFDEARARAAASRRVLEENGMVLDHAVLAELTADVEYQAGDPAAAVRTLSDGLAIYHGLGRESAILASHLGHMAWHAGELDLAEGSTTEGMSIGGWAWALTLGTLGRVRARQGRFEEADEHVREALDYWETTDYLTYHGWTLEALGDIAAMAGRRDKAIAAFEQAVELHRRKGSPVGVAKVEQVLADLHSVA
jgi:class 3 adenylate cyclase/tetratricopeptide (TPR) repeat protein